MSPVPAGFECVFSRGWRGWGASCHPWQHQNFVITWSLWSNQHLFAVSGKVGDFQAHHQKFSSLLKHIFWLSITKAFPAAFVFQVVISPRSSQYPPSKITPPLHFDLRAQLGQLQVSVIFNSPSSALSHGFFPSLPDASVPLVPLCHLECKVHI